MPSWAEFAEIRAGVAACRAERLARERRKNWIRAAIGGGVGTFVAATIFVVRALLSAGASAEASRVQAELVRDSAIRIRALEVSDASMAARLSVLLARLAGRTSESE